jgi:hypothetical protein
VSNVVETLYLSSFYSCRRADGWRPLPLRNVRLRTRIVDPHFCSGSGLQATHRRPMMRAVDRFPKRMGVAPAGVSDSETAHVEGLKDGRNADSRGTSLMLAAPRHRRPSTELVLIAARVTIGSALTAVSAVTRALVEDTRGATPPTSVSDRSIVSLVPEATLGLAVNIAEGGLDLAARVVAPAGRLLVRTTNPLTRSLEPYARRILVSLYRDWKDTAQEATAAAGEFGARLERVIVQAALESMDITEIVRDRINLNSLVDEINVERIVARLDPNEIAERIDVDRVAARLDIDALIARVDLPHLVQEVLDEIDLPDLIRESTGTLTADAIEEVRYVSVNGDQMIARVVDRFIRRNRRRLDAPGEPTSLSSDRDEHRG